MKSLPNSAVKLTRINHPAFDSCGVEVQLARLDLVDKVVSGNKWFKLKYNIEAALAQGAAGVVSFGGPFSNHLHALAAAANRVGLLSVGVIRGELLPGLTPTLNDCKRWGMMLLPVSRGQYRRRFDDDFLEEIARQFPDYSIVPEGGSNLLAVRGVSEMIGAILDNHGYFDGIVTPVGSVGTMAGCLSAVMALSPCQQVGVLRTTGVPRVIGVSALKGAELDLMQRLDNLLPDRNGICYEFWHDYHFGGFGKMPESLLSFIREFYQLTAIPLDPVYTGKMMYALIDQLEKGRFCKGQRLLVLHTGGLQGAGLLFDDNLQLR